MIGYNTMAAVRMCELDTVAVKCKQAMFWKGSSKDSRAVMQAVLLGSGHC